ncbi:NuoM family protein [Paenibacillus sp. GCM10027627]|uniref:complex I subunit 4 family protein n=1 Tax=unclassified Paenibacillus TaxID=185978 RepID=UPI00362C6AC1
MSLLQDIPILSIILLSPLLGLALVLLLPKHRAGSLKTSAIVASLVPLALSFWLFADYNKYGGGEGYKEYTVWMEWFIRFRESTIFQYYLDIDGLSLPLLLLTVLVTALAAFASVHIKKRWKSFYIWFFVLEFGMIGVFMARDLILFFVFFEITLVAMYYLIGVWGYYNRERAANQFLIYNGIGSAIMLIVFVILIYTAGLTVDLEAEKAFFSASYDVIAANLADPAAYVNFSPSQASIVDTFHLDKGEKWALFTMLLVAFGIKLPIIPFHTWMLKVHKEAPPAVVMIHSAVLLKMGAYGLIRFGLFLFPEQAREFSAAMAGLGVASLLYGAILAFRQQEFKLVLAYSSISHMGIVLIGLASFNELGFQGAVFQLVSHGLISALLFLIVGSLYERTGTTELPQLGGLARSMPFLSGVLLTAGLASLGLPGLSGFVGELLSLLGLFETEKWLAAAAVIGIILTAVYMLRSVMKITFGPQKESFAALRDTRFIEAFPMIVLLAFIVLLGCYPSVLTDTIEISMAGIMEQLHAIRPEVKP